MSGFVGISTKRTVVRINVSGDAASESRVLCMEAEISFRPVTSKVCFRKLGDRRVIMSVSSLLPPYAVDAMIISAPLPSLNATHKEARADRPAVTHRHKPT